MKVNEGIYFGDNIVLGYDPLLWEIEYGLTQINAVLHFVLRDFKAVRTLRDHTPRDVTRAINDGDDDIDSRIERGSVFTQSFNDNRFALADNADTFDNDDGSKKEKDSSDNGSGHLCND